jgi:hypothetical protein
MQTHAATSAEPFSFHVNLADDWERRYLAKRLGVSEEILRASKRSSTNSARCPKWPVFHTPICTANWSTPPFPRAMSSTQTGCCCRHTAPCC